MLTENGVIPISSFGYDKINQAKYSDLVKKVQLNKLSDFYQTYLFLELDPFEHCPTAIRCILNRSVVFQLDNVTITFHFESVMAEPGFFIILFC